MKMKLNREELLITLTQDMDIDAVLHTLCISKKMRYLLYINNCIRVKHTSCKQSIPLKKGEQLAIHPLPNTYEPIEPDAIELDICYEDELFLAVNKPAHLLVHSDGQNTTHTLCNRVQAYYLAQGIHAPVRPLHRLDKDTSGLVLFSKSVLLQPMLDEWMKNKQIHREYEAFAQGQFSQKKQTITYPIARDRHSSNKMRVAKQGKEARTTITLQQQYASYAWLHVRLYTGRTHQIRVHLAAIHHPLLGDELYGSPFEGIPRLALHASSLSLYHPLLQTELHIHCALPEDMKRLCGTTKSR